MFSPVLLIFSHHYVPSLLAAVRGKWAWRLLACDITAEHDWTEQNQALLGLFPLSSILLSPYQGSQKCSCCRGCSAWMYISFHGVRVTCMQWWVFTCIALIGTKRCCEPPLSCCHGKNSNSQAKLCINCVHLSGFKKLSQASGYD